MGVLSVALLLKLISGFVAAFIITLYFTPFLSVFAHKFGILDVPNAGLKNHKAPVPYLGGVAVYLGFIVSLALNFPYYNNLLLFLVGTTLLLFVGLIDDLIVMKPYQKMFGQIIAAFCFLKGGYYLKEAFLFSSGSPITSVFWLFISFGWMLTIINAFNLVDIMDGLSSTIALCAGSIFMIIAVLLQVPATALLLSAFLGAVAGFLWFNKPPATMYLGDTGSLFIGGFFAAIPFMIPWGTYVVHGYLTPVIVLLVPLLEVGTLILIRSWKGIPFYNGSPDHFAMYLQKNGFSKKMVLFYMVITHCVLGFIAISFACGLMSLAICALLSTFFLAIWFLFLQQR